MTFWTAILLVLLLSSLVYKLIGACIAQIIFDSKNLKESVFVHLFLGIIFSTIIYACFKSNLGTILTIPFFVILILIVTKFKQNYTFFSIKMIFNQTHQVIIPVVFGSICYIFFFLGNGQGQFIIGYDHAFFGYISHELNHFGIENVKGIFNSFIEFRDVRNIYHYADLWLVSMIYEITGIHTFYIVFMYVPVLSISILYVFILQFFKNLKYVDHFVLLSLLMGTLFCLPYFNEVELLNSTFNMGRQSFWTFSKYFFILGVFLFYFQLRYLRYLYAEMIFLFLPFFHSGTVPLGMLLLILIYLNYIYEKYKVSKTENTMSSLKRVLLFLLPDRRSIFLIAISVVFLVVSLSLFAYYSARDNHTQHLFNLSDVLSFAYIKVLISIAGKTVIDTIIVSLPFLLFILLNRKIIQSNEKIISSRIVLTIIVSGYMSYLIFNYTTNEAYQFYYYAIFTVLPVYFIFNIFSIYIYTTNKIRSLAGVLFFVFYSLYSFYSSQSIFDLQYLSNDLKEEIKFNFKKRNLLNKPGAIFYKSDYNNSRHLRVMQEYSVLGMVYPGLQYTRFSPLPDLSGFSKPMIRDLKTYEYDSNPYSVYCKSNSIDADYSEESVLGAFDYFNIHWVIETPNAYLPNYLMKSLDTTIIDSKRGTKIHFLKSSNL